MRWEREKHPIMTPLIQLRIRIYITYMFLQGKERSDVTALVAGRREEKAAMVLGSKDSLKQIHSLVLL